MISREKDESDNFLSGLIALKEEFWRFFLCHSCLHCVSVIYAATAAKSLQSCPTLWDPTFHIVSASLYLEVETGSKKSSSAEMMSF